MITELAVETYISAMITNNKILGMSLVNHGICDHKRLKDDIHDLQVLGYA